MSYKTLYDRITNRDLTLQKLTDKELEDIYLSSIKITDLDWLMTILEESRLVSIINRYLSHHDEVLRSSIIGLYFKHDIYLSLYGCGYTVDRDVKARYGFNLHRIEYYLLMDPYSGNHLSRSLALGFNNLTKFPLLLKFGFLN